MFDIIRHLLPTGRAWRLTIEKTLRRWFRGLGTALGAFKDNFDDIADDLYPATTRRLDDYEEQFGILNSGLSTQERRDRLAAAWKARGGQSPGYIQNTLQNAGFDVFVFEAWNEQTVVNELGPGELGGTELSSPSATVKDPFDVLASELGDTTYVAQSGKDETVADNQSAVAGATSGQTGKALVNLPLRENYIISTDSDTWPFFIYIGGPIFGQKANIPRGRKDEFETLCLKICPAHLWIGLLVEYN